MKSQRRPRRILSPLTILAALVLLCFPSARARAQDTDMVQGTVVSNQGLTIPSTVNLRLETLEGSLVESRPADSRGQFTFINVPRGYYRLTATADGYQTAQQPLDLRRGAGGRYLITVMLTPLNQTRARDKAVMVSATDLNAPKKARKAFEKGEREFGEEKLKEAKASLEQAVAAHPCYARALTRLGMTLELEGEFAPAETRLKKAIECDVSLLEAHTQLGMLFNHLKRFEESRAVLANAVERFPTSWQLHYHLAAAEYGLGNLHDAEEQYLKAKSVGTDDVSSEVHVRLADVYTRLNEPDKAYGELREYLRADPTGRFAKKVGEVIEKMENDGVVDPIKVEAPAAKP